MTLASTLALSIVFLGFLTAGILFLVKGHFNNNGLNPIEHPISAYCAMSKSMKDMRLMKIACAISYLILLADYIIFFNAKNILGDKNVIIGIVGIGLMPLFSFLSWICPLRVADPELQVKQNMQVGQVTPSSVEHGTSGFNHNSRVLDILHWVFAILLYAAFIMMASTVSSSFNTLLPGTILATNGLALEIIGYVCIAWVTGMFLIGRRFKVLGLLQRLYHFNQFLWLYYMAILLIIASA